MYELERIANFLSERREQLGMSDYDIARFSGVSQPTVYRFLSCENLSISARNLIKIAQALGSDISPDLHETYTVDEYREKRAHYKAEKIINAAQATSALEGQNVNSETLQSMKKNLIHKLLAGSPKKLWSD
jgi:transcriptional regulator with XRE-family HTH domain